MPTPATTDCSPKKPNAGSRSSACVDSAPTAAPRRRLRRFPLVDSAASRSAAHAKIPAAVAPAAAAASAATDNRPHRGAREAASVHKKLTTNLSTASHQVIPVGAPVPMMATHPDAKLIARISDDDRPRRLADGKDISKADIGHGWYQPPGGASRPRALWQEIQVGRESPALGCPDRERLPMCLDRARP